MTLAGIACTTLLTVGLGQTGGAGSEAPNIAVVNLALLFEKYLITSDLERLFTEQREEVTAEAQRRRDEFNVARNGLERFKPGSEDYRQREEQLLRDEIEFRVWLEMAERKLKDNHKGWLQLIYRDTQKAIGELAAQRGIDLVLTYDELEEDAPDSVAFKQQILLKKVIYASDRIDLTDEVLQRVNAEYQKRGGSASLEEPRNRSVPPAGAGGDGK